MNIPRMIWGERKTNRRVYGATSKAGNKERNFAAEEVNKEEEKKEGVEEASVGILHCVACYCFVIY